MAERKKDKKPPEPQIVITGTTALYVDALCLSALRNETHREKLLEMIGFHVVNDYRMNLARERREQADAEKAKG
jgi:hypothetical protein